MTLETGTLLHNRYRIVCEIGKGGMGAVYQATDERLSQTVALKQTLADSENLRKAFEREAKILAGLRHPALARVIDHFIEGDGQFLVMDFVVGDDLDTLLRNRGEPFPTDVVVDWTNQLLYALEYLHRRQPPVIHRDIKPQNVKLTPEGQIMLLDFGLAKGLADTISQSSSGGSIMGYTPQFAPLEQIHGTGTEPRSDLYSLAATMYYMITGSFAQNALTRVIAVTNGQADPLRPAHELNPNIPEVVSDIMQQALSLEIEKRPASAMAMRLHLQSSQPTELHEGTEHSQMSRQVYATDVLIQPSGEPSQKDEPHEESDKRTRVLEDMQTKLRTIPSYATLKDEVLTFFDQNRTAALPGALIGGAVVLLILLMLLVFNRGGDTVSSGPEPPPPQGDTPAAAVLPSLSAALTSATAILPSASDSLTSGGIVRSTAIPSPVPTTAPTTLPTRISFITPVFSLDDEQLQAARNEYDQRSTQYQKILDETFDNEATKVRWRQPNTELFSRQLVHSYYQFVLKESRAFTWELWREQWLANNYLLQLDVALHPNGKMGIVFDGQEDGVSLNGFLITGENRWEVVTIRDGKIIPERSGSVPTDAIRGDGTNQLRVFRLPHRVEFWINHTPVGTIDPVFDGGYAGIIGIAGEEAVTTPIALIADNFYVWVP